MDDAEVNNLSSGAQGPSPTRQSTFCKMEDRLIWERPQHSCEAKEKLILSLESIPAWEERSQHLEGAELGHVGTWLLQPEFRGGRHLGDLSLLAFQATPTPST